MLSSIISANILDVGKLKKVLLRLSILVVVVAILFAVLTEWAWFPGLTPQSSAAILIHDPKFGFRALGRANAYGDNFIDALRSESNDFQDLDNRNSFWVAEVLGSRDSPLAISTAKELYARAGKFQYLTGAVALASNHQLEHVFDPQSKVVEALDDTEDSTVPELALIALGKTKDVRAVPLIEKKLGNTKDYWISARASEALGEIGDTSARRALENALRNEKFYALPEAFKALVKLGDDNAIPLAIARINPGIKNMNSGFVVNKLQKVTGKRYGYDREAWQKWWDSTQGK